MQQVVEIARALASNAKVLVFDEPTSSLTRHDVERLFAVIRKLRSEGLAIIYISHFLEEIRQICDRYTVLRDGQTVGDGMIAGTTDAQIVSLMVGRSVSDLFPQVPHQPGEVILSLQNLTGRRMPRNVSLELRRGEILGIAGLVGAGRTELLRALFALDPDSHRPGPHSSTYSRRESPRPHPSRHRHGLGRSQRRRPRPNAIRRRQHDL